jgi:bacillithiol synthase
MLSSPNVMPPNEQPSATATEAHYIDYAETGYFSPIVLDYLQANEKLLPFYKYSSDINGIKQAIADRKHINYDRETLVAVLKKQYHEIPLHTRVAENIEQLLKQDTFTVTTAHQPNIFTGPLYFIYKIIHAIKLSDSLKKAFPQKNFVPVYYMGSEDADLEELGHFTVGGKKYQWKTNQAGAVGRMKVDKAFLSVITELEGQLTVLPSGAEMIGIFREAYKEGSILQQCTLELVNRLFGAFGLIVLIPDDPELKKLFIPVVEKELETQFSYKAVAETIESLSKHYKVQAGGRALNLFYLLGDKRERIEASGARFKIKALNIDLGAQELSQELNTHPDRFSPNVILRGVFQEMILPNVAFIGGGGEIAYWLELKKVFEAVDVPYPVLVLRNSFLLCSDKQMTHFNELGFDTKDVFRTTGELLNNLTLRESPNQLSLSEQKGELNIFYQQLHESVSKIDPTLAEHVNALQLKALKRINELEKKMLRTEKRRFETEKKRIGKIRSALFPNDNLQERVENVSGFYARAGKEFIDKIYKHSLTLEQRFTIVTL